MGKGGSKGRGKHVYVKPNPKEFRKQCVKLVRLGHRSAPEVAREFGISVDSGVTPFPWTLEIALTRLDRSRTIA